MIEIVRGDVADTDDVLPTAVNDLNQSFTVQVDGADAVTYSPLTYCSKVQQSPDDAELVNTTNALYLYRVEAYEYFNRNQGGN